MAVVCSVSIGSSFCSFCHSFANSSRGNPDFSVVERYGCMRKSQSTFMKSEAPVICPMYRETRKPVSFLFTVANSPQLRIICEIRAGSNPARQLHLSGRPYGVQRTGPAPVSSNMGDRAYGIVCEFPWAATWRTNRVATISWPQSWTPRRRAQGRTARRFPS